MNTENAMIDPRDFEATRLPLLQASCLPSYCYTSRSYYELEMERVFLKEWVCVGRVEQAEKPGDFFTVSVAEEPVIIARDDDGELHAMSAVCRHRAHIVAEGEGNVRAFQCPYHGWTYSLKGTLIVTPEMKETENFDRTGLCLPPVNLEVWEGFVFLNFDPDCKPLGPALAGLSQRFANWRMAETKTPKVLEYPLECNWKNVVDISMEAYHSPYVHPGSLEANRPMHLWDAEDSQGTYEVLSGNNVQQTSRTTEGNPSLPMIESLTQTDLTQSPLALIYPNLILILSSDAMAYLICLPKGPEQSVLLVASCFPMSTVERPDFEEGFKGHYEWWDTVNPEDRDAIESSQRGFRSKFYSSGRYSIREKIPHRFHNYIVDRLFG